MEKISQKNDAWLDVLAVNPLPALLARDDPALGTQVRRDLLGESAVQVETLWQTPEAVRLVHKQQADGCWR